MSSLYRPTARRAVTATALSLLLLLFFHQTSSATFYHLYQLRSGTVWFLLTCIGFFNYIYLHAIVLPVLERGRRPMAALLVALGILVLLGLFYILNPVFIRPQATGSDLFRGLVNLAASVTLVSGLPAYWHYFAIGQGLLDNYKKLESLPFMKTLRRIFWHVLGWGIWVIITVMGSITSGRPIDWGLTLLMAVPSIGFFYLNLRTSFKLLARDKIFAALRSALGLWILLCFTKGFWLAVLVIVFGFEPTLDGVAIPDSSLTGSMVGSTAYFAGRIMGELGSREVYVILVSFIYGYVQRAVGLQRELGEVAAERQQEALHQQELQKQVVDAQLQSLKYQINPHFLFNSLNFLYAQSLPLSAELSRATLLLSEMMRYALKESSDEAKVPLADEVKHLENFLEFHQLRFANALQVDFGTEGNTRFRRIMPLLLITFVENAFKYGELHDPQHPLEIKLRADTEKLTFFVKNKKRSGPKENSTGIGLDNIQRRLQLGYPDRHSLNIVDEEDFFTTELAVVL